MKIYADSLFILNFIIDYLLLLAAGKICALPLKRWRMLSGAAWGGIYAVMAAVWPDYFAMWTVKLFSGALAVAIAYGGLGRFPRVTAAFFAVSAAFGGAVYAALGMAGQGRGGIFIPVNMRVLALSFAVCYAVISLVFRHMGKRAERTLVKLRIELHGRVLELPALEDTGNELCDPISGERVIILDGIAAEELLGEKIPEENTEAILKLGDMGIKARLLSFSSLGGDGLLVCFRADRILANAKETQALVGIGPKGLCTTGEYRAIF